MGRLRETDRRVMEKVEKIECLELAAGGVLDSVGSDAMEEEGNAAEGRSSSPIACIIGEEESDVEKGS